jgi:hypothetical protein
MVLQNLSLIIAYLIRQLQKQQLLELLAVMQLLEDKQLLNLNILISYFVPEMNFQINFQNEEQCREDN